MHPLQLVAAHAAGVLKTTLPHAATHLQRQEDYIGTLPGCARKGVLDGTAGLHCSRLVSLPVQLRLFIKSSLAHSWALNVQHHQLVASLEQDRYTGAEACSRDDEG
jgi:hypothetical protein